MSSDSKQANDTAGAGWHRIGAWLTEFCNRAVDAARALLRTVVGREGKFPNMSTGAWKHEFHGLFLELEPLNPIGVPVGWGKEEGSENQANSAKHYGGKAQAHLPL